MEINQENEQCKYTCTPLPNCIAGLSGGSNIAELWREQCSELLNCISDATDGIDCHCDYTDEMAVSMNEVNKCISRLECNNNVGWTALVLST